MKIVNEKILNLKKNEFVELNTVCNGIWCKPFKLNLENIQGLENLIWLSPSNVWWKPEARGWEEEFMVLHSEPDKAIIKVREVHH